MSRSIASTCVHVGAAASAAWTGAALSTALMAALSARPGLCRAARSLTVSATLSRMYSGAARAGSTPSPRASMRAPDAPRPRAHAGTDPRAPLRELAGIALGAALRRAPRSRCRSRPTRPRAPGPLRTAQHRLAHRAPVAAARARKAPTIDLAHARVQRAEHPRLPARFGQALQRADRRHRQPAPRRPGPGRCRRRCAGR